MSEAVRITGQEVVPTEGRPRVYKDAREVEIRAAVSRPDESPEQKAALSRLGRILDSGRPLKRDVPRGFYLNIRI